MSQQENDVNQGQAPVNLAGAPAKPAAGAPAKPAAGAPANPAAGAPAKPGAGAPAKPAAGAPAKPAAGAPAKPAAAIKGSTISLRTVDNQGTERAAGNLRRLLLVAIPVVIFTLFGALYWAVIASPRYESSVSCYISSEQSMPSFAGLGGLLGAGGGSSISDERVVIAYLRGQDCLQQLDALLDLRGHYSSTEWDSWSRMEADADAQAFHEYYLSMLHVRFDSLDGLIKLEVQAFDPHTAEMIANEIVRLAGEKVNQLNHEPLHARLAFLDAEVERQREALVAAQERLRQFQLEYDVVDPEVRLTALAQVAIELEAELARQRAALAEANAVAGAQSVAVKQIEARIQSLEGQIAAERRRMIGVDISESTPAALAAKFQSLKLDLAFRFESLTASQAAYQATQADLGHNLKHMLVVDPASLPSDASYPRVWWNTTTLFLVVLALSAVASLATSIVREHAE